LTPASTARSDRTGETDTGTDIYGKRSVAKPLSQQCTG